MSRRADTDVTDEVPPGTRTLLVVDDDREIGRLLTERFEREGWRVVVERDGDWALRTFEKRRIDAVVLDLLVPVISGFQVAERIRATERGAKLPIVVITGIYRGARHRSDAMRRYHLLEYLDKPVSPDKLVAIFRRHFDQVGSQPDPGAVRAETVVGGVTVAQVDERMKAEKREVERQAARASRAEGRGGQPGQSHVTPIVWKGSLRRTPIPALLGRLHRSRATGGLFLLHGKVKKIIYVDDGVPTFVKSNVLDECLGRVLVREKVISSAECEESVRRMKAEKRHQGAILMEMGAISPHNLRFGLETQLQLKLYDCFGWHDAEYIFRDDVALPGDVVTLQLTVAQIILEGVRRTWDQARLSRELEPMVHLWPMPTREPLLRHQRLELSPVEATFVGGLDGTRTVGELIEAPPPALGARGVRLLVYAASCVGAIDLSETPGASGGTQTSLNAIAPGEESADDERIARFMADKRHADPFTILGLPLVATAADVEQAAAALARTFHPDAVRDLADSTQRLAAEAFALVESARDLLAHDGRRERIAAAQAAASGTGTIRTGPVAAGEEGDTVGDHPNPMRDGGVTDPGGLTDPGGDAVPEELPPDPDRTMAGLDPERRALEAEKMFRGGRERLRAHDFAMAEASFRRAVELRGDVGRYHAYHGWAVFCRLGQTRDAATQAVPVLERAAKLTPQLEEPHLFLGLVYATIGKDHDAERALAMALEANPESAEAMSELKRLQERRRPRTPSGAGASTRKKR